ncbi:MAG: MarR family transcriptional regulator [Verrucomicrobia bacterium]|nr:MarR family transcriptional regulator [Verrucomicrobiota bacterium]
MLQLLRDRGSLTPREIWAALKVSRQGAMDMINPLIEAGLIIREGTRKTRRYRLKKAP